MADVIGRNTPNSEKLNSYIDRIEAIQSQKKQLGEDEKVVRAEAKSEGFVLKAINYVLKARKMKPHDRQEAETTRDIYMHAAGLDQEPPLFRQIAALAGDAASEERLIEAFKLLVPPGGSVIIKCGGKPWKVWRDKDGEAFAGEYIEPTLGAPQQRTTLPQAPTPKEVPDVTADGAEQLGFDAAKANEPVISNPFPYGDERRPRWDAGWRRGSGNDGMGPK